MSTRVHFATFANVFTRTRLMCQALLQTCPRDNSDVLRAHVAAAIRGAAATGVPTNLIIATVSTIARTPPVYTRRMYTTSPTPRALQLVRALA